MPPRGRPVTAEERRCIIECAKASMGPAAISKIVGRNSGTCQSVALKAQFRARSYYLTAKVKSPP
jgi:hypothetical protein